MPEPIQRVASGLNTLLALQSGAGPRQLADTIGGVLELLQFYGVTGLSQLSNGNAALTEGNPVSVTPSAKNWVVLFGAWGTIVKTATVTALRGEVYVRRGNLNFAQLLFAEQLGPFGATETGNAAFGGMLPYPLLLPPNSQVQVIPSIIGTDANVNANVLCEFGLLG